MTHYPFGGWYYFPRRPKEWTRRCLTSKREARPSNITFRIWRCSSISWLCNRDSRWKFSSYQNETNHWMFIVPLIWSKNFSQMPKYISGQMQKVWEITCVKGGQTESLIKSDIQQGLWSRKYRLEWLRVSKASLFIWVPKNPSENFSWEVFLRHPYALWIHSG